MSDNQVLAIAALVTKRSRELGLRPVEIIRRAGYHKNPAKGLRRLTSLCDGEISRNRHLIGGLPEALQVDPGVVQLAIKETQRQLEYAERRAIEADEAAWRAAFKPHAIMLTDRERPSPLFIALMIGIEKVLRINFDPDTDPESYVKQALRGVRQKATRSGSRTDSGALLVFGRPVGVIVNYSPDHAIEYDLNGNPRKISDRAHRLGKGSLTIGKRTLMDGEIKAMFSLQSDVYL